jgi:hypothetical protein
MLKLLGWEFHAYLVQQRPAGLTIFEPADNVVLPWREGLFGLQFIKKAYIISVKRRHESGLLHLAVPVYQPVKIDSDVE